ncbi:PPC domain-containing DNA-binding protein [Rugamonas sp. CCM 8940]|uniref:PPC domain-containing DNA-binding protein n=1 Tax=Rugamonas sp. CCM 8940 TaxID=2765359 RepID=UPI0018F6C213|nr:PPC domain-containing DNA-binding protein [Rugamonas sp. CCM 8940]MBJ7314265.1 DNA-binding protein [Rugamonas sp. CCM 8940]
MLAVPLRLHPGDDLRAVLGAALARHGVAAGFVLQGIGSLSVAQLRYAGQPGPSSVGGDLEILSLAGSLAPQGAHLHMAVADAQGRVLGGHVCAGCIVRTTAEVLLALLPGQVFGRDFDAATGFAELSIMPAVPGNPAGPAEAARQGA